MTRRKRLEKLISVQEQLKAFHEAKRATLLAGAAAAAEEAETLAARFDDLASLTTLFPEIYHNRIAAALERQRRLTEDARTEAAEVALADARTNMVERSYRAVRRREEREAEDRERLEMIQNRRRQNQG